jgi:polyhydroxybutyrate depolymerase
MKYFLGIALLARILPAAPANFPEKGRPATATHRTLQSGGVMRTYLVQPARGAGPFPVVFLLHGGTQDAEHVWRQTSLPTIAAREGFIVVAPDASGRHWNDERGAVLTGGRASQADDVGFLKALIAEVVAKDHGNPSAVFMTGVSNGGFMTMTFACQAGKLLRAGANIISDLPAHQAGNCHPGKPLPWLSINGTADPLVPFDGEPSAVKNGQHQPALLSADATFRFWADQAGCANKVETVRLPHRDPSDPTWAEKRTRAGCAAGTSSVQFVLHEAGHSEPGVRYGPLIRGLVGRSNQDVDTGEVVWAHFRSTLGR